MSIWWLWAFISRWQPLARPELVATSLRPTFSRLSQSPPPLPRPSHQPDRLVRSPAWQFAIPHLPLVHPKPFTTSFLILLYSKPFLLIFGCHGCIKARVTAVANTAGDGSYYLLFLLYSPSWSRRPLKWNPWLDSVWLSTKYKQVSDSSF